MRPWHAIWVAAVVFLLFALFTSAGPGWLMLAVACVLCGVYLRGRRAVPTDPLPVQPMIPLRAMTIREIFGGTARIVARYWPTLLGIPVVILVGFVLLVYVSMTVIFQIVLKASSSLTGGVLPNPSSLMAGIIVIWVVYTVIMAALALPADALLIALSVTATDRAVRGLPIRTAEMVRQARRRIFAVCRLTLVLYLIIATPEFLFYLILSSSPKLTAALAGPGGLVLTVLVFFPIFFVLGLLLSLAPIAVVVEGRGVGAALRRSVQLLKPAFSRILAIHLLWSVCMAAVLWGCFALLGRQLATGLMASPLLMLGDVVLFAATVGVMIGFFRVLQMLIYLDVRIRREGYDRELIAQGAATGGQVGQPDLPAGRPLLLAAVAAAVIGALGLGATALSGPSKGDVIEALRTPDSAYLFKDGKPRFHVEDIDRAEPGWYVATIQLDDVDVEMGTVILRQNPLAEDKLEVFMGPGTAFPCKSLTTAVAEQVNCFDG